MTRAIIAFCILMVGALCAGGASSAPEVEVQKSDLAELAGKTEQWFYRQGLVLTDTSALSYINTLAEKIRGKGSAESPFRIIIVKSCEPNAVSFANGLLVLCTGVFAVVDNETQLAFLLAHEMAHYNLNHHVRERHIMHQKSLELVRQQIAGSIFFGALATIGAEGSFRYMMCGFSRELEKEADRVALNKIITTGYDPAKALLLFKNLRTRTGKDTVEENSEYMTHPALSERIALGSEYLRSIKLPLKYSVPDQAAFWKSFARVHFSNAQECLSESDFGPALRSVGFCLQQGIFSPSALAVEADIFLMRRSTGDIDSAARLFKKVISQDRSFAPAHRGLGYCYFLRGQPDSAQTCFKQYLALSPQANDSAFIRFYIEYYNGR
jgi:predicted Zn-dependent protease